MKKYLSVTAECNQTIKTIWESWTQPEHIQNWYFASEEWFVPFASGELIENGDFLIRMAAKDKTVSFDLRGTYTSIRNQEFIEYYLEDGRKVVTMFRKNSDASYTIYQEFEPEESNSLDVQQQGWQAILDSFINYVENI